MNQADAVSAMDDLLTSLLKGECGYPSDLDDDTLRRLDIMRHKMEVLSARVLLLRQADKKPAPRWTDRIAEVRKDLEIRRN
jgi:hypothetical protein